MTSTVAAQALFVSDVQPSDRPTRTQVATAIGASLRGHGGVAGCVAELATEYGDHPEVAAARMRWALAVVSATGVLDIVPAGA